MIGYLTFEDLVVAVRGSIQQVPPEVELIVGIPRSGMIPAYAIGLYTNRLVTDLESFVRRSPVGHGSTRVVLGPSDDPWKASTILLVDDSYATGKSLKQSIMRLRNAGYQGDVVTYAGVIVPQRIDEVDVYGATMPLPRVFEWNVLHHPIVERACFDMDGVLCMDPSEQQNDDGPLYRDFLSTARLRLVPTGKIAHIVSARLEKYRSETEEWLQRHGVRYGQLHLLDMPSAEDRRRHQAHIPHKAKVYKQTGAELFFESEPDQADAIARLSGKPVLCTESMRMYLEPGLRPVAQLKAANYKAHQLLVNPKIRHVALKVKRLLKGG